MTNGQKVSMVTLCLNPVLYFTSHLISNCMLHSLYRYQNKKRPLVNYTKQLKPTMSTYL